MAAELTIRLSPHNLDFLREYASAHRMTVGQTIECSLARLRDEPQVALRAERERPQVCAELRARFKVLGEQWRQATAFMSSLSDMVTHPTYQQIIGMGGEAVPLLLEELKRQPDHWFWALKAITGEDPVSEAIRGNVDAMREAWLAWGREHGNLCSSAEPMAEVLPPLDPPKGTI